MSQKPVVKAKSAHPSMIAPMIEGLGSTVLFDPAPSSTDETTTSSLHAIDGIDVVTALSPEEDVRQSVAIVNREDPSVSKTVCEARTGEKLNSKEVRKRGSRV